VRLPKTLVIREGMRWTGAQIEEDKKPNERWKDAAKILPECSQIVTALDPSGIERQIRREEHSWFDGGGNLLTWTPRRWRVG